MTMLNPRSVFLLLLGLATTQALAQDAAADRALQLDPSIAEVVTGGAWGDAAGAHGRYRVVVVAEGWEEVRYRVFLQWLELDSDRRDVRVRVSQDLAILAPNWWSLTSPSLSLHDGKWILSLQAAEMPMQAPDTELRFQLGPPGQVELLR